MKGEEDQNKPDNKDLVMMEASFSLRFFKEKSKYETRGTCSNYWKIEFSKKQNTSTHPRLFLESKGHFR